MRPPALSMLLIGAVVFLVGCGSGGGGNGGDGNGNGGGGGDDGNGNGGGVAPNRLQPDQLHYRGAFRLPGPSGGSNWEYSGDALTYCAQGDPTGPADGYPGSLYGVGHDWHKQVSEISIPVPVVSAGKSLAGLNTATTLRPFTDVRAGIAQLGVFDEQVRVGIACMLSMPGHPASRLYLVWGQHYQEPGSPQVAPSMMSCDLNLAGAGVCGISTDLRFSAAYEAALAPAKVPLNCAGYRTRGAGLCTPPPTRRCTHRIAR